jgi:hypothetical protein
MGEWGRDPRLSSTRAHSFSHPSNMTRGRCRITGSRRRPLSLLGHNRRCRCQGQYEPDRITSRLTAAEGEPHEELNVWLTVVLGRPARDAFTSELSGRHRPRRPLVRLAPDGHARLGHHACLREPCRGRGLCGRLEPQRCTPFSVLSRFQPFVSLFPDVLCGSVGRFRPGAVMAGGSRPAILATPNQDHEIPAHSREKPLP